MKHLEIVKEGLDLIGVLLLTPELARIYISVWKKQRGLVIPVAVITPAEAIIEFFKERPHLERDLRLLRRLLVCITIVFLAAFLGAFVYLDKETAFWLFILVLVFGVLNIPVDYPLRLLSLARAVKWLEFPRGCLMA